MTSLESCIKRNFDKMDVESINSSLTSEYKIFRKCREDSSSDKIINKSVTHIVDDHITIQKISESKLNNTSITQLLPLVEGVDNLNSTQQCNKDDEINDESEKKHFVDDHITT